jgi:signal transduction histidine kinase
MPNEGPRIRPVCEVTEGVWQVMQDATRAIGADAVSIWLRNDRGRVVNRIIGVKVPRRFVEAVGRLSPEDLCGPGKLLNGRQQSFWSQDVPNDPRCRHALFRRVRMQAALLTRLQAGNEMIGVLLCGWWTRHRPFSPDELRLVEAVAAVAAGVAVNARLLGRIQQSALGLERARIATMLHDTLSQMVFSMTLKLGWCLRRLPPHSDVSSTIASIKRDADLMMRQIRGVVVGLSADHVAQPLCTIRVRRLVDQVGALTGIRTQFTVHGDVNSMNPQQQDVTVKVVQEALANVAKHANATRAEVRLERTDDEVLLEIRDDGVGPPLEDPSSLTRDPLHFGLRQMVARIEAVGGRLQVGGNVPTGFRVRAAIRMPAGQTCLRSAS